MAWGGGCVQDMEVDLASQHSVGTGIDTVGPGSRKTGQCQKCCLTPAACLIFLTYQFGDPTPKGG